MKDILVSHTRQEKDEATGNYISVNHKGYIQHWDCCPTHTMAIILSIEGKFHSVSIDKIRVEKEDMPPKQRITLKSIEEIIKELTPIEKVQTLISIIDIPMGQEKISQGYNPLGSILKRRLPNQSPLPPKQE
mgnify:CR=1 FL=1